MIMEFTAKIIAEFLKGEVVGDENVKVSNISKIEEGIPGTLSFLANPKYTNYIYTTKASIVLVNKSFKPEKDITCTLVKVDDAYEGFAALLKLYDKYKEQKEGIEKPSYIDDSVEITKGLYVGTFAYISKNVLLGNNVKVYPHAYIGDNAKIGDNTIIYSGAKIYHDCVIGNNCIIHSGAVVGSDGFGFAPQKGQDFKKIPQIGNVLLEDNVEIGANTTIDRATFGSTIIRKGVKLDNLIQIAHNVEIGERTVIAAQVGISGSSKIGNDCMIGGQVGIAGHLKIANKVKIGAQAGIDANIKEEGKIIIGSPAFNFKDYYRSYVIFKKLPEMNRKLAELEKKLNNKQ